MTRYRQRIEAQVLRGSWFYMRAVQEEREELVGVNLEDLGLL
jgi:hypothetical protein